MNLIKDLGMAYPTNKSKIKSRFGLYECSKCLIHFKANTNDVNRANGRGMNTCKICARKKHGSSKKRIYRTWQQIIYRTTKVTHANYNNYGGRGITVCNEWMIFEKFEKWSLENGYLENLTIDRIDNDGNYDPSNCRFVNYTVQARNKRITKLNTSGFIGVSYDKGRYRAYIHINNKKVNLGSFKIPIDAAKARDKYIIDNKLEHTLNKIPLNV